MKKEEKSSSAMCSTERAMKCDQLEGRKSTCNLIQFFTCENESLHIALLPSLSVQM